MPDNTIALTAWKRRLHGATKWFRWSKPQQSNLVIHAQRELALIGEEPDTIKGYLAVVQAFADMGHSGGSASVAIPVINELLQFRPLSPVTNDPDEWVEICREMSGGEDLWQNRRDGRLFSNDGGATYYSVDDPKRRREIAVQAVSE